MQPVNNTNQQQTTAAQCPSHLTLLRYPLFDFLAVVDVRNSGTGGGGRNDRHVMTSCQCIVVQHLRQAELCCRRLRTTYIPLYNIFH